MLACEYSVSRYETREYCMRGESVSQAEGAFVRKWLSQLVNLTYLVSRQVVEGRQTESERGLVRSSAIEAASLNYF